ncbi:MAG: hypothetical protein AAF732_16725, partial [Pseudomonadota bacterium]
AVVMITPAIGAAVLVGYLETQGAPRRTMMIALAAYVGLMPIFPAILFTATVFEFRRLGYSV